MSAAPSEAKRADTATRIFWGLLGVAAILTVLRPWLPDGLVRIPEVLLLPWRDWIDAAFDFIRPQFSGNRRGRDRCERIKEQ